LKRFFVILICLFVAVAPALAWSPMETAPAADECGACACETRACCAESSKSGDSDPPATPVNGGKRTEPTGPATTPIELPSLTDRAVVIDHKDKAFSKRGGRLIYVWNCAFLI